MNRLFMLLMCLGLGSILPVSKIYSQTAIPNFQFKIGALNSFVNSLDSPVLHISGLTNNNISPNIKYPTPQVYAINQTIPALLPFNFGGAVPPTIYGQVTSIAGPNSFVGLPSGIVTDAAGNCFFTNYLYGVGEIAITGSRTSISSISSPACLTIDRASNLYVTSFDDQLIYKITPGG